ncbi:hypothetical protein Hanom_Chr17g01590531 [Helianthus anomalus]
MSPRLLATTTFTGSSLVSGIGSDFINGFTFPSCANQFIHIKIIHYYSLFKLQSKNT